MFLNKGPDNDGEDKDLNLARKFVLENGVYKYFSEDLFTKKADVELYTMFCATPKIINNTTYVNNGKEIYSYDERKKVLINTKKHEMISDFFVNEKNNKEIYYIKGNLDTTNKLNYFSRNFDLIKYDISTKRQSKVFHFSKPLFYKSACFNNNVLTIFFINSNLKTLEFKEFNF